MQHTLCKALQIRSLKSVKNENKQKKGEGLMKRLIGFDTSSSKAKQQISLS